MKKTPQEWYRKSLVEILSEREQYIGNFNRDDAYKYVIKSFTDKYSNSFIWEENIKKDNCGSEIFDMYWHSFRQSNFDVIFKTIITSEQAYKFLTTNNHSIDEIKKALHLEHLTPMSYSREKLLSLKEYTEISVGDCFKYSVVALIEKNYESKLLDHDGKLTEDDLAKLRELQKKHPTVISDDDISEAENLFNNRASLLKNGNGLLRLIHLVNKGVSFVDEKGTVLPEENVYLRLIKNEYKVNQYEGFNIKS